MRNRDSGPAPNVRTGRPAPGARPTVSLPHSASAAFTLIELLLVTALLGLVIAAVGSSLWAGIRVWEEVRLVGQGESGMRLALESWAQDVANAPLFFDIPVRGDDSEMSLPRVETSNDGHPAGLQTVAFGFRSREKAFVRSAWPYPGERPSVPPVEPLASGVSGVRFEYLGLDDDGSGGWSSSWSNPTNRPAAVRCTLTPEDGASAFPVERTVFLYAEPK